MEFMKHLVEGEESIRAREIFDQHSKDLGFELPSSRRYEPIVLPNGIMFSVQASALHYCFPKVTLDDPTGYQRMEMAMLSDDFDLIRVKDVLPTFSRIEEIERHHEVVYSNVPVDLIEALYQELRNLIIIEGKEQFNGHLIE